MLSDRKHIKTNVDAKTARSISINIVTGYTSILRAIRVQLLTQIDDSCINISIGLLVRVFAYLSDSYLGFEGTFVVMSLVCVSFFSTLLLHSYRMLCPGQRLLA